MRVLHNGGAGVDFAIDTLRHPRFALVIYSEYISPASGSALKR